MPIDRVSAQAPSLHCEAQAASSTSPSLLNDIMQQLEKMIGLLIQLSTRASAQQQGDQPHGHATGQQLQNDPTGPAGIDQAGDNPLAVRVGESEKTVAPANGLSNSGTQAASGSTTSAALGALDNTSDTPSPASASTDATSVEQAASTTPPKFLPVLRGDEQEKDAQIKNQDDFAKAVDQTAKEYGLNPDVFRARLQVESGAFSQGYQKAMHAEGDLDRAVDNNTSIGLGQISRKFLDGRDWAHDGPGNARIGSQVVTTAQYENSITVQLRMAASNLAQRIQDYGGLEQGLSYYVSGDSNPNDPGGASYIQKIDAALKDPAVLDPGRSE